MRVIASSPENKDQAKRLQGLIRSLIRTGFVNAKEIPEKMTEDEARAIINNLVNGGQK